MGSLEVFYEFLIMKTSCQGVYQNQREGMTWTSFGEGNTGDTRSCTEHIYNSAQVQCCTGSRSLGQTRHPLQALTCAWCWRVLHTWGIHTCAIHVWVVSYRTVCTFHNASTY